MATQRRVRAAAIAACIPALLTGCTWLATRDFDKGTEIATIDIGKAYVSTRSMNLPKGDADLRFVVRGYDCGQPLNAAIEIEIRLADGSVTRRQVDLDELTWPRSGTGCHVVGYLRSDDETLSRPLRFTVNAASNPVGFSLAVTRAAETARQVHIWVVHNDRDPVARMLGVNAPE